MGKWGFKNFTGKTIIVHDVKIDPEPVMIYPWFEYSFMGASNGIPVDGIIRKDIKNIDKLVKGHGNIVPDSLIYAISKDTRCQFQIYAPSDVIEETENKIICNSLLRI